MKDNYVYEIRVQGHLDGAWQDWLGGLALHHGADGTTEIRGELPDQAALFSVLMRLHDMNLPLLLVRQIRNEEENL